MAFWKLRNYIFARIKNDKMEIITFDSEVYRELKKSLDTISNYVLNKEDKQGEEDWVDEYDVCTYLKISRRTLQRIRYENLLTYSLVRGKVLIQMKEVRRLIETGTIKCDINRFADLCKGHKAYLEQRKRNKKK